MCMIKYDYKLNGVINSCNINMHSMLKISYFELNLALSMLIDASGDW